ncbi:hybrid sensor histidine kinase/response regulator [Ectothiorhodospira lacustris]|uniref:hybrid sensor histidine kinase/response regulator n=1 Tax=Ectothiorhodospira lacustris TaxID=2899127 RepID=UPI001EE982BF|nr:Hpt domain-containing protein [Ectothiorhodospira lacustris]MCG5510804.1 Hpt domain-containing protein [Ectothiorhodospira lacustris]MCG5522536.1 Hpt domain-containing protein [Ectothiorhodospira lacustris]
MTVDSQQFTALRWVKKELDALLTEARAALEAFIEDTGRTEKLEEARRLLDQGEGTLQMLDLHGAAMLAREMSALTGALLSGEVTGREEALETLIRAFLQLPDYLEHLRAGHRDVPLVLLPLLNDLRTVRKASLLSDTVFFFPDLATISARPLEDPLLPSEEGVDIQTLARVYRHQYQLGLVSLLRGAQVEAGAQRIDKAVGGLRRCARRAEVQRFFWVVGAVSEALRAGGLEPGATIKQLLGQVDRQIRFLIENDESTMAAQIPDELLRNLLYYAGRATSPGPLVTAVQEAYRLRELLPDEAELRAAQEGLSGPNQELMLTVSSAIREDLADVKDSLDVFMHTGGRRPEALQPLVGRLRNMADTLAMVGMTAPREIALREADILESIMTGDIAPDEAVLMQVAADMLNMEAAIRSSVEGPGDDGANDGLPGTLGALSPTESRALMSSLMGEALADLARVKDAVDTFVHEPGNTAAMEEAPGILDGLSGALAWLSLDGEVALLQGLRDVILSRCIDDSRPLQAAEETLLADVLTALECALEARDSGHGSVDDLLARGRAALARLGGVDDVEARLSLDALPLDDPPELEPLPELPEDIQWEPLSGLDSAAEFVEGDQDRTLQLELPEDFVRPAPETADEETPAAMPESGEDVPEGDRTLVIPQRVPEFDDLEAPGEEPLAAPLTESDQLVSGPAVLADDADPDILEVFLEEADEEVARIGEYLPRWRADPGNEEALLTIRRSFHTIKGSGRLVGAHLLGEFAWANENLLNRLIDGQIVPGPDVPALLEAASEMLPHLVAQIRGEPFPMSRVQSLIQRLQAQGNPAVDMPPVAPEPEVPAVEPSMPEPPEPVPRMDPVLLSIFAAETRQHLQTLETLLNDVPPGAVGLVINPELLRAMHTLNGSARTAEVPEISSVCGICERYLSLRAEADTPVPVEVLPDLRAVTVHVSAVLDALEGGDASLPVAEALEARFRQLHEQEQTHQDALRRAREIEAAEVAQAPSSDESEYAEVPESGLSADEPDPELVELFLEEAVDILHAADASLDLWSESLGDPEPVQAFQRQLHTLKGGARMAGMTPIGDLSHALESLMIALTEGGRAPEAPMIEVARQALDQLNTMVEQARQGGPVEAVPRLVARLQAFIEGGESTAVGEQVASPEAVVPEADTEIRRRPVLERPAEPVIPLRVEAEPPRPVPQPTRGGTAGHEVVRVRADVLDNLVNYAGEVNIYHARMEQQITSFGFNLSELEQTIQRLREQLRKLEMETEAQILFRHEQEQGEARWQQDFDPLELDRYSNIQQLSRALAESVSDLSSIQGLLTDQVRDTETLLLQQTRVSTDLQEGLMHTRMVQFATIVPRLRRIVRQTAAELGKRVELEVEGEGSELDRSVLERMMAPMEHMLRNAISHGIEAPPGRRAQGKDETGQVRLRMRREGSEVVLEVSDDGAGVDLEAVRAKVARQGLSGDPALLTEQGLMQFILESGFSTATHVSQISGRGVGMDVVNSEIKQLGGVLAIDSTRGRGTCFTIRLPFTLAISQALLVQTGDEVFAVPLSSIEGILRMQGRDLADFHASADPTYEYAGNTYEVKYLGSLLKVSRPLLQSPDAMFPVLLVRSGDHRIALHVDALMGSREVVIKPVGPQVSRVKGIAGATILGDGRVVMILDIPALVRAGAGVRLAYHGAQAEPAPERQRVTVMVVDDSITIRKVTARALERQGYQVLTARDGVDAVAQLQEQVPDLMLLDIEMPRMDGFELATHIRNDARLRRMPIIMITSRTGDKHRQRAMEIGVNRYLGKPYQEMDLLMQIREVLGGRHGAGGEA